MLVSCIKVTRDRKILWQKLELSECTLQKVGLTKWPLQMRGQHSIEERRAAVGMIVEEPRW